MKFGVEFPSLGNLSRLFDPVTGSQKLRNHFPSVGSVLVPFSFLGPWKEGEWEPEPEPEPEPTPSEEEEEGEWEPEPEPEPAPTP